MRWDTFLFLNETEVVDLRFHTLADVVDRFVVVETATTFAGRPNAIRFPDLYRERWSPCACCGRTFDVLHHVARIPPPAPGGFPHGGRWACETALRNSLADALRPYAMPEDYVLISDADEIPDPEGVGHEGTFRQRLFLYQMNAEFRGPWHGTVGVRYRDLGFVTPQYLRARNAQWPVHAGGWHFSYMGGPERMREKVMAGGDAAFDTPAVLDRLATQAAMLADPMARGEEGIGYGRVVPLDDTMPAYLRTHRERFAHLLREA